ncbi:survival of motor neuron-related-splicing factor 30-like [Ylistrum balloti]|uniref:survival of motor neuron-related-splicing factor 30-like n=1 Tax=Ylistrum balloti TaxID=509963 RepID=UPI002905E17D|nr:survival of motor neuron-related-splicing factor 30-like [Ylistrum balloti]
MADDLQSNLATYKLQLQQVEASLTNDADNEDLLKLKKDLQEVIDLTTELVGQQKAILGGATLLEAGPSSEETETKAENIQHAWKSGDMCMAMYSEDGQYYEATVDEVLEDGTCTVKFNDYGNTDVTEVKFLKPTDAERHYATGEPGSTDTKKPQSKKDLIASQREYKRKKSQKKAQRLKQMEEERESEKNKWLDFNSKTFSKTNKGRVKKSIFATTEHVNGRVGVGTCGVSGRPMTSFTQQEKWKK